MRGRKPSQEFDVIADHYRKGLSLRKIATLTGKTHQSIACILKVRKVEMRTSNAKKCGRRPKDEVIEYEGLRYTWTSKGYWRCTKFTDRHNLARRIWEQHNGEIPTDFEVYYIDGNRFNLDIKNLGCASRSTRMKERLKDENLKAVLYAYGCYGRLVRTMKEDVDPSLTTARMSKMWNTRRTQTDPSESAKKAHQTRKDLYGKSGVKDPEAVRKQLSEAHMGIKRKPKSEHYAK